MLHRILACLLVLGVLAGCGPFGPDAPNTPTPTTVPPATATTAPPPPAATPTGEIDPPPAPAATPTVAADDPTPGAAPPPETERQLLEIEEQVSDLRGLEPKEDVPEYFVTSNELKEDLKQQIDAEYSPEEGREDAMELWLLRLIKNEERNIDIYQIQIDLLGEQVLGYYDPEQDELYVRNDQHPLGPEAKETLAHEFVHSLQDQHYDLEKMRPDEPVDADRDSAVTALIEGDATISGLLYAQRHMTEAEFNELIKGSENASTTELNKAPAYIRESLIFPYVQGVEFALALYQRGGFAAIDEAFADPPATTEQILHPEKYLSPRRDEALPVALPPLTDTLGAGWTMKDHDTLGEFDLGVLLQVNGADEPEAVAGWGGSRYAIYRNGDAGVLIMGSRWDTARDADEFDNALHASLAGAMQVGELWQEGDRFAGIKHIGDQVFFVGGTDPALVERALAEIK
jgi:hypothetical protein